MYDDEWRLYYAKKFSSMSENKMMMNIKKQKKQK